MKPRKLRMIATMLLLMPLCGCQHVQAPLPVSAQDSTKAFIQDPQFPAMAQAAPDLTKRILRRVTELEVELANSGH